MKILILMIFACAMRVGIVQLSLLIDDIFVVGLLYAVLFFWLIYVLCCFMNLDMLYLAIYQDVGLFLFVFLVLF